MLKSGDDLSSATFHNRSLQSKVDELEMRFRKSDEDNALLRKDKQILVEHVAQLQKKVSAS